MEWLAQILTSSNSWITILGLIALILLLAFLTKKGLFAFKGKGVVIGNDEIERTIIRTQIQWAEADCNDMLRDISNMPNAKNMDMFKGKYTIERVLDELVKIIIFNHITLEPTYVKLKQDLVWGTVSLINPEGKWNELEPLVRERVKNAIESLYNIRKYFKDKE